jgi:DNA-binding NarL/FixJ family response regulator
VTEIQDQTLVGRERELASVASFVDAIPEGPRVLLLEGEAGIGKTTIWLEAVGAAEDRGFRVLQARPAESEAKLSYAVLADLVGHVFDETRPALPAPQERALATVLLRAETDKPADARTTATALVGVLTALATEQPLLLAIDDVQWLDAASDGALGFAARRLPQRTGLLVTRRADGTEEAPLGLDRVLLGDRFVRVLLGGLSLAVLRHLISGRLGVSSFPRSTLARVAEASGGNPFFALEIAQALTDAAAARTLDDPLPVPRRLQNLVADRLGTLSAQAQEVVLAAATLSRPTVPLVVEAMSAQNDALPALLEAEEAGVLVTEHERIRFTHPLLASGIYGCASDARRRQLHRRLAEVVTDTEERARHLAQSVTEADETTAAEIEQAARQVSLRGANAAAAELFEASCRLTPADRREGLARRRLGQAAARLRAGDIEDARRLAKSAVAAEDLPAALQAEGFELLASIELARGTARIATEYLEAALAAAVEDRDVCARLSTRLVLMSVTVDPVLALARADAAMALVREEREPGLLGSLLLDRFWAGAFLGRGARRELLERGLELEAQVDLADWEPPFGSRGFGPPHPVPIRWFACVDDVDATRARHMIQDEWLRAHGEERLRAAESVYLALVELRAGRWDLAEGYLERSCETNGELDASGPAEPFAWRSLADAYRGRFERARSTLLPLIKERERLGDRRRQAVLLSVLGFVEFAAGNHEAADRALTLMHRLNDAIGLKDELYERSEPHHIESLLELGQFERAHEALARLVWRGRTLPRLWIDVTLPRARALILAADGDVEAALAALDELDIAAASKLPFELACALVVKGRLQRRLKQRASAANTLGRALEIFERLGAPSWVEQARSELARAAPRRRSPSELTATERRVAELAAAGLTNREVAQAAFMSPKTVEANLARVYRKLGIRSRAELGSRMSAQLEGAETRT